ncbi:MAG: N-6 DNA methylase [Candidatus Sericytochromatia bacterium]
MNNLFNIKLLKRKLDNFNITEEKLKNSSEIISNWASLLISGELDKQNEKMLQGDFLKDFFQIILDYTSITKNTTNYNFKQHPKTETDKRREPDGAIGFFDDKNHITKGVIELKGSKSDLDKKQSRTENLSPVEQAFFYLSKYDYCDWVIVSNFKEIRLYSKERGQGFYHSFKLLDLKSEIQQLKMFIFLLSKENLISKNKSSIIFDLLKETTTREEEISEKFYEDYKKVRKNLFEHISKNNVSLERDIAFLKVQKLLDRFIFICFCEDCNGLLPKGIIRDVYKLGKNSRRRTKGKVWEEFKNLFMDIDLGRYDIDPKINKYNGGLFSEDNILNNLIILDDIWEEIVKLSDYDFETDLTVNILGHIFEQSISDLEQIKQSLVESNDNLTNNTSKRKKDGIFYTPPFITDYLVKNTIGIYLNENPDSLEKITILDPACGSGAFLNQAHDFLVKEYDKRLSERIEKKQLEKKKNKYQLDILDQSKALSQKKQLLNNLYGIDLNEESVEITRLSLWLKTADKGEELANLDKNIMVGNSLINDEKLTKKAFNWNDLEIIKNGGIDVIIGNPPYLNIQGVTSFHSNQVNYFSNKYISATGKYDLYVLFLEQAFNLLKENGRLGFIIPHKFINADFGTGIRKFLKENKCVEKIISFGENLIFEEATTYTALVFLRKEKLDSLLYYEIKGKKTNEQIENEINQLKDSDFSIINYDKLEDKKWIFSDNKNMSVLDKLNKQPLRLKDVFSNISQGIVSNGDDIFILKGKFEGIYFKGFSERLNKEVVLEKDILKPILKGEDVKKYRDLENNFYIIFPHYIENKKTKPYEEDLLKIKFPLAYNYLSIFKDELLNKKIKYKNNTNYWYSLHRSREISFFEQEKIITPQITLGCNMVYDIRFFYHNTKCYSLIKKDTILEDYKYFLTILNSKLLWFFIKNTGDVLRGGYYSFTTDYLKDFPIPKLESLEQQKPFIEKAEQLMDATNNFYSYKDNFLDWLITNLKLEKHKSKLEHIHKISKDELFNKLKDLKVDLSDINLFGSISKNHSILINHYNNLNNLENEANYMVYKLYGLTEEDIKIIENDTFLP